MKEILGSHVSFSKDKQLLGSVLEALSYHSNTFMFYTGAPQNTTRLPIDAELTSLAHNLMDKENINIENVIIHAPYIVNLANPKNYDFNVSFFFFFIRRAEQLGITKIVLHPGSHVGLGIEEGIKNIATSLNDIITSTQKPIICLETMAGKGSEVGSSLEELKAIIDKVELKSKIAVCIDTCHLHDAGYDLENFDDFLKNFDQVIGLEKLLVAHINDSKNEICSHKDRHENIGYGKIGFNIISKVVHHSLLKKVPKILETPYIGEGKDSNPPYLFEIEMLQNNKFNENLNLEVTSYYTDHKNK